MTESGVLTAAICFFHLIRRALFCLVTILLPRWTVWNKNAVPTVIIISIYLLQSSENVSLASHLLVFTQNWPWLPQHISSGIPSIEFSQCMVASQNCILDKHSMNNKESNRLQQSNIPNVLHSSPACWHLSVALQYCRPALQQLDVTMIELAKSTHALDFSQNISAGLQPIEY